MATNKNTHVRLLHKHNFDLHFDVKTIADLDRKVKSYGSVSTLIDLMMLEIWELHKKVAELKKEAKKGNL
jgi:hypothetical protein